MTMIATPEVKPVHRLAAVDLLYRALGGSLMETEQQFCATKDMIAELLAQGRCVMLWRQGDSIGLRSFKP